MTGNYVRVTGLAGLFAEARELSVRTVIFDVEPLVAPWHGSQESLDQGIARILGDAGTVPSLRVVVFATNSARRPTAGPGSCIAGASWCARYCSGGRPPAGDDDQDIALGVARRGTGRPYRWRNSR